MGTWFAQWQNRLPGWLNRRKPRKPRKPRSDEARLRRTAERALLAFTGAPPDKETVHRILQHDRALETWYADAKNADASQREASVSWDGLRFIEELRRQDQGYLLVFVQPYLSLLLEKLAQEAEPVAGVVFHPHEDPSAHIPVLERGHGLAFSLSFFPEHGDAVLTPFFQHLTCVSTKALHFAVQHQAPVIPLWARMTSPGDFVLHLGRPSRHPSVENLTLEVLDHFMRRMQDDPEQMDWTAACWHPPAKRLLTSRKAPPLLLRPDTSLEDLQAFSILARVPDDLRQACLAIPALRALKSGRPDVQLTLLAREHTRPLWNTLDACDAFVALEETASRGAETYQLGVVLCEEESAASDLAAYSVERLVGMENHPAAESFDDPLPMPRKLGPPQHRHRRYLRLAHRLGAEVEKDPALWAPLEKLTLAPNGDRLCLGLAPASELGRSYEWPRERFEELLRDYPDSARVRWHIFLPQAREEEIAHWKQVAETAPPLDLVVEELAEDVDSRFHSLGRCHVLVSNDSRLLQLASVMGLGTVGIYGPGDPVLTAPAGDRARTVYTHVECHPCNLPDCPLDHRCLRELAPGRVVDALHSLVERLDHDAR